MKADGTALIAALQAFPFAHSRSLIARRMSLFSTYRVGLAENDCSQRGDMNKAAIAPENEAPFALAPQAITMAP